jgi:CBS domain-containing protein
MAVRDYCRRDPVTVTPDQSVREAAKLMQAHGVGMLVAVDAEGRPVGVLTDRDVTIRLVRRGRNADSTPVEEVMNSQVSVVSEGVSLELALRRMRADAVRRMPVVDGDGRLVGIVTLDDALQLISSEIAGVAEAVRAQFPADTSGAHALAPQTTGG